MLYELLCLASSKKSNLTENSLRPYIIINLHTGGSLTYMSIDDDIAHRAANGMLFPLLPKAKGEAAIRAMFVGEKLWALLNSDEGDTEWERRVGELQADLEVFVTSEFVNPKYLFLLDPASDAVWEIRSVGTDPSMRVLGLFAKKDVYVAADVALREDLGAWNSRAWKQVKRNARAVWRQLFAAYNPILTINVHDVVTGAISGKYFK